MKFTFGKLNIGVTAKFIKAVHGFNGEKPKGSLDYHNQFRVKLLFDGKERFFIYHGSIVDYWDHKTELNESDLKRALGCILCDAILFFSNFEEFCDEFGYDSDSRNAEITYQLTLKNRAKVMELGFTDDDLYSITNAINDEE